MNSLFAYGSLLHEDIFKQVTGLRACHSRGILRNFRRLKVRDEEFPGIIAMDGCRVPGAVYHDLPETAWKRLDRFEGDMYERREVLVDIDGSGECAAFTYVVRPEFHSCLTDEDWDPEAFRTGGKQRFIETYCGFDTCRRQS